MGNSRHRGSQAQVKLVQVVHHALDGETFLHELLTATPQALTQRRVPSQPENAFAQPRQIARVQQEPGLILQANFSGTVSIVSDNGPGGGQCLGQSSGQALAQGQMHKHVHDAHQGGTAAGATRPAKTTCFSRPRERTRSSSRPRQGPSPISRNLILGQIRTMPGATASRSSCPLSLNRRAILPTTISSGARPNLARSCGSLAEARNGSSGKPLRIMVYCSVRPIPASRYCCFMASATTTKWLVTLAA